MHVDVKKHGVHYTPPRLARFLAEEIYRHAPNHKAARSVLDPACGDGELLLAFAETLPRTLRKKLEVYGFERDSNEAAIADSRLKQLGVRTVNIQNSDFLESEEFLPHGDDSRYALFAQSENATQRRYDYVIANPPYVRTQVLGVKRAKALAKQFGLKGRVDLYQAFAIAMVRVLKLRGTLGLITSNRFLTIKSGTALREFLQAQLGLQAVYDLGDTKLFNAAVLPAIVIGTKESLNAREDCSFVRAYEQRAKANEETTREFVSVLDAIGVDGASDVIKTPKGRFRIERGRLRSIGAESTWFLHTPENEEWLARVAKNTACVFSDIANVRVGIKTTADEVFIRDDWSNLPDELKPDRRTLRPLITHEIASRWSARRKPIKQILYPHRSMKGRRQPINLESHPSASKYLNLHRERLESRKYVIEAGRNWFEIWVPHNPADWHQPKIVYPDIAENACFFLDCTGALVNGDCYWITLKEGVEEDWLYLMLGVANSSFVETYYDTLYHNKLYAGRRRFMTQYVKTFPLPLLECKAAQMIINFVRELSEHPDESLQKDLENYVAEAFGLSKV